VLSGERRRRSAERREEEKELLSLGEGCCRKQEGELVEGEFNYLEVQLKN
jgi:hypothetical protein